ncbi:aminotransferase class I/II-fold pyridoxal phosphate-dependent enzyme [Larkinella terrae]|uniref:Aminotransferase class I/II-fold pyridoxal phosphate-dependent enzyme n=2 Tax=Larkinella terrae TaxID=2025311 RepID=A0A7K0EGI5_9BACT|nr:aminotransferase class I/II-fold pyridoxal phosphate-dependent enzyme [Larkinella terrae]
MGDLKTQYLRLKTEIDAAVQHCLDTTDFINGASVREFQQELAAFLWANRVVTCASGTDALQIALMGLGLKPGDEVILPVFTHVAVVEVVVLLGLSPVWVDVDPKTFTITAEKVEVALTSRTKAVIPVHLFGQCADMEPLLRLASDHGVFVVEDAAHALGSEYELADGSVESAGTLGQVGCVSFSPFTNLGCYGDGGALITNDEELADRLQMITNHGQRKKYIHEVVGVNSRLDTLQAAILSVKLKHLSEFNRQRQILAARYDYLLAAIPGIQTPVTSKRSSHVYQHYTVTVPTGLRDALRAELHMNGIPSMVYYPVPVHLQPAYYSDRFPAGSFPVAERLSQQVLSLPIYPEMESRQQDTIVSVIADFMSTKKYA